MYETPAEAVALQDLMDRSRAKATSHLQEIIGGDRVMTAEQVLDELQGMKVFTLATVTAKGEPRISAVDGHFLHGSLTFGTDGRSAKATHLDRRPSVSAAYVDGERVGIFCHGRAVRLTEADASHDETIAHWTKHYGEDPRGWADDIRLFTVEAHWLVGYRSGVEA